MILIYPKERVCFFLVIWKSLNDLRPKKLPIAVLCTTSPVFIVKYISKEKKVNYVLVCDPSRHESFTVYSHWLLPRTDTLFYENKFY